MDAVQGMRIHVIALFAAVVLAGCGAGGSDVAVKSTGATTSTGGAATTTSADRSKTGHRPRSAAPAKRAPHAQAKAKKPAAQPKIPADIKRAQRIARQQGRSMIAIAKLCTPPAHAGKPPALPTSTSQLPRYARAVLPTVRRNAQELRTVRAPAARRRIGSLATLYDITLQALEQIGEPGASRDLVKVLGPPTARQVVALHKAAIGMGAPQCALPV